MIQFINYVHLLLWERPCLTYYYNLIAPHRKKSNWYLKIPQIMDGESFKILGGFTRGNLLFKIATVFFIQELLHAWWNMVLCRNLAFQSFIRGRHTWNSNFEWCILPWFVQMSFSTISYALHRSFVPKFPGLLPNFLREQISRVPSSITRMCTRNNRIRMYIKLLQYCFPIILLVLYTSQMFWNFNT